MTQHSVAETLLYGKCDRPDWMQSSRCQLRCFVPYLHTQGHFISNLALLWWLYCFQLLHASNPPLHKLADLKWRLSHIGASNCYHRPLYRKVVPAILIYASQAQLTTFRHFWNISSNKKGLWWHCKYSTVKAKLVLGKQKHNTTWTPVK